jgi:hypothetical protein
MEDPACDSTPNGVGIEAEGSELGNGDDPVLTAGQLGERLPSAG